MDSTGTIQDNANRALLWVENRNNEPRLFIKTSFRYGVAVKKIAGARYDGIQKAWHVPASPSLWDSVELALNGLALHTDDSAERLREAGVVLSEAANVKDQPDLPDIEWSPGAWQHQRRAFYFAERLPGAGLFLDMGGGKSKVAVAKVEMRKPKLTLILCPKSVMGVWAKQFRIHGSRQYDVWTAEGAMTIIKKSNNLMKWAVRPTPQPKIAVVNYDSCWRGGMQEVLMKLKPQFIILDESHKIKAASGKASRFAMKVCKPASDVLLLTGTPMPHGPEDIYGQYRAAAPEIFGTSYNRFTNRYFNKRKISNGARTIDIIDAKNPLRADMADEFHRKVASISIIVKRDEMGLDVPQRLPSVERYCELTNKTMRHYNSLLREFITELEDGSYSVADNALTKLMRLRQLCSGFLKDDEGHEHNIGDEKQRLFAEVLDELPRDQGPIVCFAAFHHDLDAIRDVASDAGLNYGELSGRRRDGLASDSTLAPGFDVVGVQLQSGGVGVDFTRSRFGIYYSIDYNLGNIEQSFARLDRPGQQHRVSFIHLITKLPTGGQTVDGTTYQAIEERRDLIEATLEASRR